ncbi:MAG: penicillin-binding protein 2 [Cephaloticoccus sp.]|nr:penicillin-binding protein 2 [Cephaloticoccus sp.]MCF7760170.1 penicillin-binding protein 2 [Cephaloticoccus sp.]
MSKGFASNYRIFLLSAGVFVCLAGIGTRLVFLHVIDRGKLLSYIGQVRRQVILEPARRGAIYDSHQHLLAANQSMYNVGVDPQALRSEDRAKWPELATLTGMSLAKLERIMTTKTRQVQVTGAAAAKVIAPPSGVVFNLNVSPNPDGAGEEMEHTADSDEILDEPAGASTERPIRWAKLHEDIDEATYEKITALGIKGVYGNRVFRRVYPHNSLAAHLVGYVNKAGVAAAGIESYADFYLRGQDGWREGERDGLRRELAQFRTRDVQPVDGFNVVLSIDIIVQHMVEEELEAIRKKFNPDKATIIVSDARTGFILAIGNYPSYDLNHYNTAPLEVQRNFAITDQLDPGSTFKIVPASGALNEGIVRPNTRFDCSIDSIVYKGAVRRFMPDDHHYDHLLPVSEIISRSSNIGAAQLGMVLGEDKLYEYARQFGFGEKSGFPFGGEISGLLNPVSKWSGIDITRIPAGYSISATPLQIHYAMGTIASGGLLLRPQIIKQIRDASGETVYSFDTISRRRVITTKTAKEMAKMLEGVVRPGGTAIEGAIPGYEVAGKTGTAQKLINGRYSSTHHVGSFVGFFPASRPEVVISVIVDNAKVPSGNAYGRVVGAPSFKRIGEQLIQYLDIKPPFETGRNLFAMRGNSP